MISAKIIAHSKAANTGTEIITWELEYPRFIHSELMTHRVFSRNAASSRAIPIDKQIDLVLQNTATPVHWGANQRGMAANHELHPMGRAEAQDAWQHAMLDAVVNARKLRKLDLHKQIVNRVIEPFAHIKTVVTGTEWTNFFGLRDHADAQPEIRALARRMKQVLRNSPEPFLLQPDEWHVPYVKVQRNDGAAQYSTVDGELLTAEEAVQISASCCAQVSYRVLNQGKEKALDIYKRLVDSKPVHASPFEHQARPMVYPQYSLEQIHGWEKGTTHLDRSDQFWSGNFKHWVQHRQLIPGHDLAE